MPITCRGGPTIVVVPGRPFDDVAECPVELFPEWPWLAFPEWPDELGALWPEAFAWLGEELCCDGGAEWLGAEACEGALACGAGALCGAGVFLCWAATKAGITISSTSNP
jgi:hypothetical protein